AVLAAVAARAAPAARATARPGHEFKEYDPTQPRDAKGRWGSGGSSTVKVVRTVPFLTGHATEIEYKGIRGLIVEKSGWTPDDPELIEAFEAAADYAPA